MKIKLSERITTVEDNNLIVSMEGVETIQGSQRMLAVGQGVRARIGVDADGRKQIEAILFDRDKYDDSKVESWLETHEKSILEAMHLIQVNAPDGSFEDKALRIQRAIDDSSSFTGVAFVEFVFDDKVIVSSEKGLYEVPWTENDGVIEIGEPTEVTVEYKQKQMEALNAKIRKRNEPNWECHEALGKDGAFKVLETSDTAKGRVYKVVLIEAGTSFTKKRHYPRRTIQEAAPEFAGLKMYLNHPTDREEYERPERSLDEWISTITEAWYEDGKAMGLVHVHNKDFMDMLEDKVFMEHVGISINASGRRHEAMISGEKMEIIDRIFAPRSVDWVTEAGARGRVLELVESIREKKETKEIAEMNLKEFKEKHPDKFELIKKEISESMQGEVQSKIDEAVKEAVEKAKAPYLEAEKRAARQKIEEKATKMIEGSGLPKKGIKTFCERFLRENPNLKEEDVEESVKKFVKSEAEHLKNLGIGVKVGIDAQHDGDNRESVDQEVTADLEESLGLNEKEDDKK